MRIKRVFVFAVVSTSTVIMLTFLTSFPPIFHTAKYAQNEPLKSPAPGAFLRHNTPSNESYCYFNYGLPEELSYKESDLQFTPELGRASPYRVLYDVIKGRQILNNTIPVTYATHITADFTNYIAEVARSWEGPISVAAFVPDVDADIVGKQLIHLCYCLMDMSKVSVHFVFPANETPYYLPLFPTAVEPEGCIIADISMEESYRTLMNLVYPVNVCRNVAKAAAQTHFVLVSDVQLIPSDKLASKFLKMIETFKKLGRSIPSKKVFVLPLFEVDATESIPRSKKELVELVWKEKAVHFHRYTCSHCQKFPGLEKWLSAPITEKVQPFIAVKREYPYHRWEPIYIGRRNEPHYSENLSWEGQQDKMTQMLEMCLMGYRFVILDGAFLVHWPGIKRNKIQNRSPYWSDNARQYNTITNRLTNKYSMNLKCTKQ